MITSVQQNKLTGRIIVLAVFLIGLLYYCLRITGFGLEFVPGDLGDARFINYLLEHGHRYIIGDVDSFWSPAIMYPTANALAFSDNMIGSIPLYSIFRFMQCDAQTAYQLWWITVCALNFFICTHVVYRFTNNYYLSAIAGFVFAFGLFNQSQMSYLQMNTRFMVPLIFWYTYSLFNDKNSAAFGKLLLCLVVQFYLSIYLGFLSFYSAGLFAAVLYLVYKPKFFHWLKTNKNEWIKLLLPSIGALLALIVLLWPYYSISSVTGLRMFKEVVPSLPEFSSYFFAHESSLTWSALTEFGKQNNETWWLQNIMPGILPLIVLLAGSFYFIVQKRKKLSPDKKILALFLTAFVLLILFTRTANGLTLYAVIFKLPGMNSMRVLTRYMHVELFLLVLIGALLLNKVKWLEGKSALYLLVFALVFTDNLFDAKKTLRTPKTEIQNRHNIVIERIKAERKNEKIVAVTGTEKACYVHLDAMFSGLETGMPVVNGYSSYCEADFGQFFREASPEGLNFWMKKRGINPKDVLVLNFP